MAILFPAVPLASADYGAHYGSLYRGCGVEGFLDVTLADCPLPYHGGWVEKAGCDAGTCALRLWHGATSYSWEARAMEVRTFLVSGTAIVELCEASGAGNHVACEIDAASVSFPKAAGCSPVLLRTDAREPGSLLFGRAEASFNLCREGDEIWFGPSVANAWVGGATIACPDADLWLAALHGCYLATGGEFGATSCAETTCDIAGSAWGVTIAGTSGPRSVIVELVADGATQLVCANADLAYYAVCTETAETQLTIVPGECVPLSLRLTYVVVDAAGINTFEVPFEACRSVGYDFVDFHNA